MKNIRGVQLYLHTFFGIAHAAGVLFAAALLFVAIGLAQPAGPEAEADHPLAPVVIDGNTLFRVRGASALPAEQRAAAIATRIEAAAADTAVTEGAVDAIEADGRSTIMAGEHMLMVVTQADAELESVDRASLVVVFRDRISQAIKSYRHERSSPVLLSAALHGLGAILALLLVLFVVARIFRHLRTKAEQTFRSKIKESASRSLQVLPYDRLWSSVSATIRTTGTIVMLLLVYACADYVLALFPWTRQLALSLFSILIEPLRTMALGFVKSVPNLMFVVILAVVLRYGVKLLRLFFQAIESQTISFEGFDHDWAMPTYRIARIIVVAFGLVVAYPYLPGSESDAFKGVSLFLGVMLSLGSSSAIANIIAGYSLIYRRAFKLGDRVKIGEAFGDVASFRLQVTHIRSVKNEEIIIPNSEILNTQVINYSTIARQNGLILHTTVGIGYETPWRQVEAMLLQAAERTPGLMREPSPFVLQKSLGDFAVTYEINAYCEQPKSAGRLYTALHRSILDVFNEHGVQIMTPAYEGDPPEPKVVPKDKWFESPATAPQPSSNDHEEIQA